MEIIYSQEAIPAILDSKIQEEEYTLMESKEFQVVLTNPSEYLRFCIIDVFVDTEEAQRLRRHNFPFCIGPQTKYPFTFVLYAPSTTK